MFLHVTSCTQGDEDKVVPPEQAIVMHEAVRARGVPTALVMFKVSWHHRLNVLS